MREFRATKDLIAVSANTQETAINTEQTLDTSMLVSMSNIANREPRRESNADELTGYEEPDTIYDLGDLAGMTMDFPKAQPQHFAFLMAYALGSVAVAAAGTGYEHTLTPASVEEDADRSNPSFTLIQRLGDTVVKERFASMFVDGFNATFSKDDWCKISATIKGTGKVTDNVTEETITVTPGADPYPLGTSLTLAANAVEGADAQTRLDNVQYIRKELSSGEWTEVVPTAVSDATPAVITIPAANADDVNDVDFKVIYIPEEAAWCTFPARVTETPLRVAEMTVTLGGAWDGSAFQGGKSMTSELRSIEWNFANNGAVEFVPGAGDAYAARYFREGRTQTVRLDREFRDFILQNYLEETEYFGLYILAEGAIYDSPHKYQVEIIFPRLGVINSPRSVDGKRLVEAGDLQVLTDSTYGTVIVNVKNLQATYAA